MCNNCNCCCSCCDSEIEAIKNALGHIQDPVCVCRNTNTGTIEVSWGICSNFNGEKTLPALYKLGYYVCKLDQSFSNRTVKLYIRKF